MQCSGEQAHEWFNAMAAKYKILPIAEDLQTAEPFKQLKQKSRAESCFRKNHVDLLKAV